MDEDAPDERTGPDRRDDVEDGTEPRAVSNDSAVEPTDDDEETVDGTTDKDASEPAERTDASAVDAPSIDGATTDAASETTDASAVDGATTGDAHELDDGPAASADDSQSLETDPADQTDGRARGARSTGSADGQAEATASPSSEDSAEEDSGTTEPAKEGQPVSDQDVPADVRKYDRFQKIEGGTYDRANEFLRDRTYITAREWAISRLCADFRTETGVEMTKIGENLPELVPFMTDTYSPQAVNQARASFEDKVRMAGATFLYGALSDFFTADELDEVMYEATEVAKFLLEVEGVELSVEEELEAEDRISEVMREVREHSVALRHDEVECPECGHSFRVDGDE